MRNRISLPIGRQVIDVEYPSAKQQRNADIERAATQRIFDQTQKRKGATLSREETKAIADLLRGGSTPSPTNLNEQLETMRLSKYLFKAKFENEQKTCERLREALRVEREAHARSIELRTMPPFIKREP